MDKTAAAMVSSTIIDALFATPQIDGRYSDAQMAYFGELGRRRPLVLFAFAPRSAGTFLRTAAIIATDGRLMRFVHAEGERDASLYLPILLAYFEGHYTTDVAVTHMHMQANTANCNMLDAFDLRPIIMLRSIPDMLSSLWSFLDQDEPLGFSFLKPADFADKSEAEKADLMIDVIGPWYVQYFVGWKRYAEEQPARVCVLDFADLRDDPAGVLEQLLAHARAPCSYAICEQSIASARALGSSFRCNPGRTPHAFGPERLERLSRLFGLYPELAGWRAHLLPPTV